MNKVACALLVHNKKLLLHLRDEKHPDPNLRNKWGLVGGVIEEGEEPLAAVIREIQEESNLIPSNVKFLDRLEINKPDVSVEVFLFYSRLSDEEVKSLKLGNEGLAVEFFSTEQILTIPLSPEVKKYYSLNQAEIVLLINNGKIPSFIK